MKRLVNGFAASFHPLGVHATFATSFRSRLISSFAPFSPAHLKALIEQALDADKAEDIVAIDLAGKSSLADYMIIATGRSHKHIAFLADHLCDTLSRAELSYVAVEGKEGSDWVVVDAGDIIVHLFHPEARRHYNLEKMWAMPGQPVEAISSHL